MASTKITSRAPTRIDLAGGTVDIWPLYLFLKDPVTINLGIDLYAEAVLEESLGGGKPGAVLRSDDQDRELAVSWDELSTATLSPAIELHAKLLRHFLGVKRAAGTFDPSTHLTLRTRAKSPAGAGLGGSSTLSIAMVGALQTWATGAMNVAADGERFIDVVRDVETTVIQVPAGLQDYYGAMFGGLQALRWGQGGHRREWLDDALQPELEKRLLLFYSGQSRNSGINNWALYKGFIDREAQVRERFAAIAGATSKLEAALVARDWAGAGRAISGEWEVRRTLAAGISTPEMDRAFASAREESAELAFKICGAGGGGCFFIYSPSADPALLERVSRRVLESGAGQIRALPFHASRRGLEVQVTRGA